MNAQRELVRMGMALAATWVMGAAFATQAAAACFESPRTLGRGAALPAPLLPGPQAQRTPPSSAARVSIVGLWMTEFLLGDGPTVYDQMFQQYHEGGTETSLSNGLPPLLGNVCLGIWTASTSRKVEVKHVAWNWNPDGSRAGTFVMLVQFRINADGSAFAGSWSAKNYDVDGNHLPDLDAAGIVRGTRITMDE